MTPGFDLYQCFKAILFDKMKADVVLEGKGGGWGKHLLESYIALN